MSKTRFPPPSPLANWWPSFVVRDWRHDVLPERRLSARWWPVEEEFQGSNVFRMGSAAGAMGGCGGGMLGGDWWGLEMSARTLVSVGR